MIDGHENDVGEDERVRESRNRVGDLMPELHVMVVDEAARNPLSVESGDGRLSEDASEKVAKYAADRVRREDLSRK